MPISSIALGEAGVDKVLAFLSDRFSNFPSVRMAMLIGARARGDFRPRADIEIAVAMPDAPGTDWTRLLQAASDCPTLLRIRVLRLDTCDVEARLLAETEGILFYHPWGRPWEHFRASLESFGRILSDDLSIPVVRDGLLFRFGRTVELFHRLLRMLLNSRGITENGLKDALALAYQQHWITDEEHWLSLLQAKFWADRAYDQERILPLVEKMPRHYSLLLDAAKSLQGTFGLN